MTSRAITAELFQSTLLILALLTMSSCQVLHTNQSGVEAEDQTDDAGNAGPSLLEGGHSPSFSLKERFRWAIEALDKSHSRQKRIAFFTVKFPSNTQLQIKWSLAIPIPAESKYKSKLSLALPITVTLPRYLIDDPYTPDFNTLFGNFREGEDTVLKEKEEEEGNDVKRRKRDLHVMERMELYDNFQRMMDSHGLPGQACLQRTVCEVAEAPLQYGVIGDFLNVIFTPSVAAVSAPAADLQELDALLAAEEVGRLSDGARCGTVFAGCPTSVFDSLPLMRHTKLTF